MGQVTPTYSNCVLQQIQFNVQKKVFSQSNADKTITIFSKSQIAIWIFEDIQIFSKTQHLGQIMPTCSKCVLQSVYFNIRKKAVSLPKSFCCKSPITIWIVVDILLEILNFNVCCSSFRYIQSASGIGLI